MRDQIDLLSRLQDIDQQITLHERNVSRLPLETQEIARTLVATRREIGESKDKLALVEKDLRLKERDLATEQDKIKRSEKRLLGIKNQKEYNALNREVKLGKKVVSELEDSILELMNEMETINRVLKRKETEYASAEEQLTIKKQETELVTREAEEALVGLKEERGKIETGVDPSILKRYDIIQKGRGNALAEMNNGSCSECHMAVPVQLGIRVMKQEELLQCPNCHRILYVKPENIPEYNVLQS